jgi:uncharacterized membrane protein
MDALYKAIADLKNAVEDARYELSNKITSSIRWSFVFCVCSTATTIGVVWLMLKK